MIEVAPKTYYIDMTFVNAPREYRTFFINTQTRQTLSVHTNMREGEIGHQPRAVRTFVPGVWATPPSPPRASDPARPPISWTPGHLHLQQEQPRSIYLNDERYAWHSIIGPLKGESDVEPHTTYKFDMAALFFLGGNSVCPSRPSFSTTGTQMRETSKFFAVGRRGHRRTPAGAIIRRLSVTFYPDDATPL